MMQSLIKFVTRKVVMGLMAVAVLGAAVTSFTDRAEALGISVGTPTVISGVTIDASAAALDGDRVHVAYTTTSATEYSLMYASNSVGGGYTLTIISSGAIANKPRYLNLVINPVDHSPHVYFYDASSTTINHLVGPGADLTIGFVLGSGKVTTTGLSVAGTANTGLLLAYSSRNADGTTYSLQAASAVYATDAASSFIVVAGTSGVSGSANVASGQIAAFFNATTLAHGVVYFDSNASALRLAYVAGGAVSDFQREVIDTGSSISDIFATDGTNVTRVVYTDSSLGLKLAVQRRKITNQAWYIQRIDTSGTSGNVVASGTDTNGTINLLYVKSSTLQLAKGRGGVFFDDFSESIVNTQRGLVNIGASALRSALLQNPSAAGIVRGNFVNAAGTALNSLNWTTVAGTVVNSWGAAVPSVRIRSNVTNGGTGVAADLDPAASGELSGGLTDGSGAYTIDVASASSMTLYASSTSWSFVYASSHPVVIISTPASNTAGGITDANFIALSSSVINALVPSSATVASDIGGTAAAINATFVITSSNTIALVNGFTKAMNARLIPQSAAGTAATVSLSTLPVESGSFILTGEASSASQFNSVTSTHIYTRYSSTDTSNIPKYYTLVVATRTQAGHVLLATKADALRLGGIDIAQASGTLATSLPGLSGLASSSTINSSIHSTFLIRSSSPYTNVWASSLLGLNLYLTTSTVLPSNANVRYNGDIPLGAGHLEAQSGTNNQVAVVTGSIVGATAGSWYIRISSRPTATNSQFALSPAITISSPAITSVRMLNALTTDTSVTIDSTGTAKLLVDGRGFISGATWAVTLDAVNSAIDGMPVSTQAIVVTNQVMTSTSALLTVRLGNQALSQRSFYVAFATSHFIVTGAPGVGDYVGLLGSTSSARSVATSVTVSSAGITRVVPDTVANTRSYALEIFGRGLLNGASIQFLAVDGSTTATAIVSGAVAAADSGSRMTATVDFRQSAMAGKTYNLIISSDNAWLDPPGGVANATPTIVNLANPITVSSMTVSQVIYPSTSNTSATIGLYNSAGNPTIGLKGVGLVSGSTVHIPALMDSFIANLGNVNSSGTFASFTSTGFFNRTAGSYQVGIGISLMTANVVVFNATTTTNVNLVDSVLTSVTPVDNTNFTTMHYASFTITGTGLQDGATVQLAAASDTGAGKVGGGSLSTAFSTTSINSVARTTATAVFDLRSATVTAGTYTLFLTHPHPTSGPARVLSGTVSINRNPIVNSLTSVVGNNSATRRVWIHGQGLTAGATVLATPSSINTATTVSDLALGTVAFLVNGGVAGTGLTIVGSSGTTGFVDFNTNMAPGTWTLSVSTHLAAGGYNHTIAPTGASGGTTLLEATYASSGTVTYTVSESSAPNAPTGLTVLASGVNTVTLRWIAPGDDGTTNALDTSDSFVLYYSSGEDIRGQGCAPCYPAAGPSNVNVADLNVAATNFTFAQTWAQFLPFGYANSALSTTAITNNAQFNFTTSTTRGLTVSTITLPLSALTVNGVTPTSITPGTTVQAVVTIAAGSKDSKFWFVIRAVDEAGNISSNNIVYTTASATILASAGTSATVDPNAGGSGSVTVSADQRLDYSYPPGLTDGADTITFVPDSNPPQGEGTTVVGSVLDINLGSGKSDLNKTLTLSFVLSGAALAQVQAADPNRVKLAFFNGSRWVPIADSSFSGTTCSGRVTHLTKFGVIIVTPVTNLDNAMVYPNPYRPSLAAHRANNPKITFDLLPAGSTIKIFTIAGDLVRDFADVDRNGSEGWDAKNSDGQDVASGVYIALIDGGGDKKTMKVAVQR